MVRRAALLAAAAESQDKGSRSLSVLPRVTVRVKNRDTRVQSPHADNNAPLSETARRSRRRRDSHERFAAHLAHLAASEPSEAPPKPSLPILRRSTQSLERILDDKMSASAPLDAAAGSCVPGEDVQRASGTAECVIGGANARVPAPAESPRVADAPKPERPRRKAAATAPRELSATLERKEILELFEIFEASAACRPPLSKAAPSAVAPAASFEAVLRASYPKADGPWVRRMMRLVRAEQRALARRAWMARATDLEPEICRLFGHVDRNGSKSIDLPEFLQAAADAGLRDTAKMEALFRAKDEDGNGTLDVSEFICLVGDCPRLLERFDDIVHASSQKRQAQDERERQINSVSSLPPLTHGLGRTKRPSLADVRVEDHAKLLAEWCEHVQRSAAAQAD